MAVEIVVAWIGAAAAMGAAGLSWAAQRASASDAAAASRYAAAVAATATTFANDKTVLVGSVTSERAKWRSEIRLAAAELVGSLRVSQLDSQPLPPATFRLISEIALRLNPLGRDDDQAIRDTQPLDRDIYEILAQVVEVAQGEGGDRAALADRLERAVGLILKQEWVVSKQEAVTGKLASSKGIELTTPVDTQTS